MLLSAEQIYITFKILSGPSNPPRTRILSPIFYTVRKATEYDTDYVKKYDEDLNTILVSALHITAE